MLKDVERLLVAKLDADCIQGGLQQPTAFVSCGGLEQAEWTPTEVITSVTAA